MRAVLVICAVTTRPSWATCASISTTRSCASLAPAGGFQQRSICAFTTSISLVVSCGPSGATGCDDAFACCWGAVVGFGGVSVFCDSARFEIFFINETNCCSSCFFLLGSGGAAVRFIPEQPLETRGIAEDRHAAEAHYCSPAAGKGIIAAGGAAWAAAHHQRDRRGEGADRALLESAGWCQRSA